MQNKSLERLQQKQLDILKEFIRVVNKLNLNYFVIGGTLLGAVRHEGFIPWDDDIDIGMPRDDYEIFLKYGQKYIKKQFFIQTSNTDSDYLMGFAKIRDSNTTLIESAVQHRKINHGVYIDIFPLDGIPKSQFVKNIRKTLLTLHQTKIYSFFNKDSSEKQNFRTKVLKLVSNTVNFGKSPKELFHKIDNIVTKYNYYESTIISNYFGAWGERETMPKNYFGKGILLPFENLKVNAPTNYDGYLKNVYGDYMILPPKDKRVSHHSIILMDLDNSYKKYVK